VPKNLYRHNAKKISVISSSSVPNQPNPTSMPAFY